jgi:23S rRNA pseudoU1915 N3-methylase RlmH
MNDEQVPDVEEIKARLKAEIPVEEDAEMPPKGTPAEGDVAEALRRFGKQFAETLQAAWNSEQRREVEQEIREGVKHFGAEMEKVLHEAKVSPAGQKVQEEAADIKTSVEQGEFGRKAKSSIVQGLQWFSDELANLAQQLNPQGEADQAENTPKDES